MFQIAVTICMMTAFGPECSERTLMDRVLPLRICQLERRRFGRLINMINPNETKEFLRVRTACFEGQAA